MKNKLIALLALITFTIALKAQPVAGFLGKRFMSSFEFEIVPGFQEYETNQSEFLAFFAGSRSYTPRIFINTDYQLKQNLVVSGAIGYANLKMPVNLYYSNLGDANYVTPMTDFIVQLRLKNGTKGLNMPTSSYYIAYGIGLHFLSIKDVPIVEFDDWGNQIDSENIEISTTNIAANIELGRRIVFKHGIVIDFGVVVNLSRGLFDYSDLNYSSDVLDKDYYIKQMRTRNAINSLFNFKIGVGLFY